MSHARNISRLRGEVDELRASVDEIKSAKAIGEDEPRDPALLVVNGSPWGCGFMLFALACVVISSGWVFGR